MKFSPDFTLCDFTNPLHRQKVVELLDHYMQDPMGGGKPMPETNKIPLVEGLANLPGAFVVFAMHQNEFIGMATCFVNFSTFKVKPYINVHDLVVVKPYRSKGVGRQLLEKIIDIARERNYCRVTLEVRDDNKNAQGLYRSLGFEDCDPPMYYWMKTL